MSAMTGRTREDLGQAGKRRWLSARHALLSSLTVAIVATSPAVALADTVGHAVHGTRTTTTTLDIFTGTATSKTVGHLDPFGAFTGKAHSVFVPTSATTFTFTGTATLVPANGDQLFATFAGSGAFTSATTRTSTNTYTIDGGTGRFAHAGGTMTETIESTVVAVRPTSETTHDTATLAGTITY